MGVRDRRLAHPPKEPLVPALPHPSLNRCELRRSGLRLTRAGAEWEEPLAHQRQMGLRLELGDLSKETRSLNRLVLVLPWGLGGGPVLHRV